MGESRVSAGRPRAWRTSLVRQGNAFLIRLSVDLNGGGRLWQGLVLVSVLAGLWLARALWMRGGEQFTGNGYLIAAIVAVLSERQDDRTEQAALANGGPARVGVLDT
jgi:hypothetical protein